MAKIKEKKLKPVINYFEEKPRPVVPPTKQTTPCNNHKHSQYYTKPFIGVGICLVCNPDYDIYELFQICEKPGMRETYEVLRANEECYALACLQSGEYEDGIGYRWCAHHIAAVYWLYEGARLGFPRRELGPGTTLQAGQESWVGNARAEAVGILSIQAAQMYAPDFLQLKKFFDVAWEDIGVDWQKWLDDARAAYAEYQQILKEKGGYDGEVDMAVEEVQKVVVIPSAVEEDDDLFGFDFIDFS